MQAKPTVIATAVALAMAASPAHAVLERMGPVDRSPTIGGFPAWFQDKTGITLEFCDPKTQAELDKGWCVLIPPGPVFPENFPNQYFNEHFYFDATNVLKDAGNGLRARLTIAVEAAFTNNAVVDGDQMTFGRMRVFIPNLPIAGDWRVITPFSDKVYPNQKVGDRIFDTSDVGIACPGTFECTLNTAIGPFLLPSAVAGGAEVPPMPDLITAPPGTDPFYDSLVALGGTTADPGTGKQYLADPARIGPVTGSPLANFTDSSGASRNHNNFRIEVRSPSADFTGTLLYAIDGENNFTLGGRLMTGAIPGKVTNMRGSYKADGSGNVTALDVFAKADPTVQARLPAQPQQLPVVPALQSYDVPCAGAIGVDPTTGQPIVNPPPYSAPAATPHEMAATGPNYWVQSTPGGLPPSHVCIVDTSARNAAGQVVPAYYLRQVTDDVTITTASFNGPNNGTMTVNATSTDPTAVLTLAGFGPAAGGTPGVSAGIGAGTGLDLAGNAASVTGLLAPPAAALVTSSKGGSSTRPIDTASGAAVMVGTPTAVSDSANMFEDCSPTPATVCPAGQSLTFDLIANDSVLLNGQVINLRQFVANNMGTLTVTALAPRNGVASVTPDGIVTYTPNANFNGTDAITYTVTVDGQASNQAALNINVSPVNDLPVAGNTTVGAVVSRANQYNLISTSTDPDGNADVKDAVILTWPVQLGAKPVPVNGVISYTPTSTGNFSVTYQAKDASGALSANTATGTVSVLGSEAISITKAIFKAGNVGGVTSTRWTVSGTDTVREGETLTIVYNDGQLRATGASCNGTAANPSCVIGTAVVDGTGAYLYDVVGTPGGPSDPTDSATWSVLPKNVKVFSTSPVLGGSQNTGIQFK